MMLFKKFHNDLKQEFTDYNKSKCVSDLLAGLTVTAVAIPLALAFGVGSGATAASGLITAIVAGLLISALGGAYYQISGPTGAMAAILMSIIAKYDMQGVFIATVLAGIILIFAGLLHLGKLISFIPMPVITGFTSGIAIIIALGQIDNFFGVQSQGSSTIEKLLSYGQLGFAPNWEATGIGCFVVLMMLVLPRLCGTLVPASLLAIILAIMGNLLFGFNVTVVGEIPTTLFLDNRLEVTGLLDLNSLTNLLAPAASIAVLAMIESLLCGATAGRMTGAPLDSNRELVAQGIGNLIVPFFGGIPATAAIARTSVAVKSGAKTRLTGIFHALGILAAMFILAPVMSQIPLAALAGVLMVVSWRMNEWATISFMVDGKFAGAIFKFIITMLCTIIFDLTTAIVVGVMIGLILQTVRFSHLRITYDEIDPNRLHDRNSELPENGLVCYITGPIVFANTERLEGIAEKAQDYSYVYFSMRGVPDMDISGTQEFGKLVARLQAEGKEIYLCSVQEDAMEMMRRGGIYAMVGQDCVYWSVERALCHGH